MLRLLNKKPMLPPCLQAPLDTLAVLRLRPPPSAAAAAGAAGAATERGEADTSLASRAVDGGGGGWAHVLYAHVLLAEAAEAGEEDEDSDHNWMEGDDYDDYSEEDEELEERRQWRGRSEEEEESSDGGRSSEEESSEEESSEAGEAEGASAQGGWGGLQACCQPRWEQSCWGVARRRVQLNVRGQREAQTSVVGRCEWSNHSCMDDERSACVSWPSLRCRHQEEGGCSSSRQQRPGGHPRRHLWAAWRACAGACRHGARGAGN